MRRTLMVLAILTLLITAMATPVAAGGSFFHSRSSGYQLDFSWIQLDRDSAGNRLPPMATRPFGNTHIGFAFASTISSGRAFVSGQIADLDCPVDYVPPFGGGHGGFPAAEEPENPCTHIGVREIFSDNIPLTIDRKLEFARLGGVGVTIGIFGGGDPHGGGGGVLLANVPINTTFTGFGATSKGTFTETWTDGTSSYRSRYATVSRQATMGGILGPMGYAEGLSGGSMSSYREMSRQRTS